MQKRLSLLLLTLLISFLLSACNEKEKTPKNVAEEFWASAQQGKLDSAKQLVSWDSASYLKYFKNEKIKIKRVEFGEITVKETLVTIETTLILDRKNKESSDLRIPTQTILIKTEGVWRVQLKQTLAAVINKTINAAANQFNQMLQEGMLELNKALTGSLDEISKSLQQGAKELGNTLEDNAKQLGDSLNQFQQELEKSLPKPEDNPASSRKEI